MITRSLTSYYSVYLAVEQNLLFVLSIPQPDSKLLLELTRVKMPYGKYKGSLLCNLPVSYLEWFQRKGFPEGKLGILLQIMLEIKMNGLDYLLQPLKNQ